MSDAICTRCGREGHRASTCTWPIASQPMRACMGGWCRIRSRCQHYTDAQRGPDDADRLCMPGEDGEILRGRVDNPLLMAQLQKIACDHLNWLFPTATPAGTPGPALSPAGGPPLPGNPGPTVFQSGAA